MFPSRHCRRLAAARRRERNLVLVNSTMLFVLVSLEHVLLVTPGIF